MTWDLDDLIERLVNTAIGELHHDASEDEIERQHEAEVLRKRFRKILLAPEFRKIVKVQP